MNIRILLKNKIMKLMDIIYFKMIKKGKKEVIINKIFHFHENK